MSINSKEKGKVGEREVVHLLESQGVDARRGQQHKGTPDSPDIITNIDGVHVEAKFRKRTLIHNWLSQAYEEAGEGDIPVLFFRRNNEKWHVVVPADDLPEFCRRYLEAVDEEGEAE